MFGCVSFVQGNRLSPASAATLPLVHIRAAALDLVGDCLVGSDCNITYAQDLASQLWSSGTACDVRPAILEILPRHSGLRLVSFIATNYPLVQIAVERELNANLVGLCRPSE